MYPEHCEQPLRRFLPLQRDRRLIFSPEAMYNVSRQGFHRLLPHLPMDSSPPHRIMDIGCGFALYDIQVLKHFGFDERTHLYLLDQTVQQLDTSKSVDGFQGAGQFNFYTSLQCAVDILKENGARKSHVHALEAAPGVLSSLEAGSFDVIYSLLSWGFHYPVTTYLSDVYRLLKPGTGRLVVDIRVEKKTGKESQDLGIFLNTGFACTFDRSNRKSVGVLCTKK